MHDPYENRLGHKADFRVKYTFRSPEEGGRITGEPSQGIRSDFSIEGEGDKMYMIWPEFEDENGELILDSHNKVPNTGTARMWVINDEMRPFHYDNIKVGLKAYFREGANKTADCEIVEILDLKSNRTKQK